MTRPRGTPPTPRARSRPSDPVEMTSMATVPFSPPSRMMAPFPNCFSICWTARSRAFDRSLALALAFGWFIGLVLLARELVHELRGPWDDPIRSGKPGQGPKTRSHGGSGAVYTFVQAVQPSF